LGVLDEQILLYILSIGGYKEGLPCEGLTWQPQQKANQLSKPSILGTEYLSSWTSGFIENPRLKMMGLS